MWEKVNVVYYPTGIVRKKFESFLEQNIVTELLKNSDRQLL